MDYIKGVSFINFSDCRGKYANETTKKSIKQAKEDLGLTYITLCFMAMQETAHTTEIDFNGPMTPEREELLEVCDYAHELGLKVILKPMLDCKDGTWRAHINFFDIDEPCENTWGQWFESYTEYMVTFAKIAQQAKCEMLVIGTELVQTDRRTSEWIMLINNIRKVYDGLLTYNCDKYQEENVKWWDHVDVISASGYYPYDNIEEQIARIELFVKRYNKPYFFAEAGCPARVGSKHNPNDWSFEGALSSEEQAEWIQKFIEATKDKDWMCGYSWWAWRQEIIKEENPEMNDDYDMYRKPAAKLIKELYSTK
jgi:hypothetical protein